MKLLPSDPDIQTIVTRIESGDLDLQPDFQRGEVWSDAKKRRLVDTVLRDWHIPPVHVIERPDSHAQEVLDGQQRLAAIRDFVNGVIKVDGKIEPIDHDLASAHDCTYETLPRNLRRRFDQFTIRVFRLVDFKPGEPGELFFRLNQPTGLTSAEQRNAFFGPVRQQVRDICNRFPKFGLNDEVLGFSNSRMAFDDIVGKLCLTIEQGTLLQKITAATITERYRSEEAFPSDVFDRCEEALANFGTCAKYVRNLPKFNKATVYSWLCFFSRDSVRKLGKSAVDALSEFLGQFEFYRFESQTSYRLGEKISQRSDYPPYLLHVYTDRASLRVGDVSSVLLRDAVLAYCLVSCGLFRGRRFEFFWPNEFERVYQTWQPLTESKRWRGESELLESLAHIGWGCVK
ncbi:MAG TPA: DUF262 domain-containing protein [Verrucomicrobiales bacterium]|nr:DUF262 domain-containing protein [Verrucomicrobiales bacterium]